MNPKTCPCCTRTVARSRYTQRSRTRIREKGTCPRGTMNLRCVTWIWTSRSYRWTWPKARPYRVRSLLTRPVTLSTSGGVTPNRTLRSTQWLTLSVRKTPRTPSCCISYNDKRRAWSKTCKTRLKPWKLTVRWWRQSMLWRIYREDSFPKDSWT